MRCIGCAIIGSTGCVSMPSTPSSSPANLPCCRNWASAVGEFAAVERPHDSSRAGERRQSRSFARSARPIRRKGKFRAQWNDDYHHAWHVLLTGENKAITRIMPPIRADTLRASCRVGFAYQGEPSPHRQGEDARRSRPAPCPLRRSSISCKTTTRSAIARAATDFRRKRMTAALAAALAVMLLAPMPPLLFMGEEWGSKRPFPFFCDFSGELADAVRKGRREEFKSEYAEGGDEIPDPLDEADISIRRARLGNAGNRPRAAPGLILSAQLLTVRKQGDRTAAGWRSIRLGAWHSNICIAEWTLGDAGWLRAYSPTYPTKQDRRSRPRQMADRTLWGDAAAPMAPWSVVWTLGAH